MRREDSLNAFRFDHRLALFLGWSWGLAAAGCTAPPDPEPLWGEALVSKIDSVAEETIRAGRVAGFSIGVKRGGELLLAKCYGYANLEDSVAATAETVYRIGSITKQFTAAAVLQLAEVGALSLDAPVTDYLPNYPTQGHRVTIRHLLTHTSGIKNYTDPDVWSRVTASERSLDRTNEELRAMFQDRPFAFAPGEQWRYSNSGYLLLGMVIEAVSGMSYRDYVADRLFRPLELESSSYCDNLPTTPLHANGYERAYGEFSNAPYLSMNYPGGAGALCSSVLDLLSWSSALRSGGAVSIASYEQMITPAILERGDTVPYGFGLQLRPRRGQGQLVISHGGAIEGFVGQLSYYHESELDVVVLSNTPGPHVGRMVLDISSWALDPAPLAPSR